NPSKPIPESWASNPDLYSLMQKESGGRVGVPNYTFGNMSHDSARWGDVHRRLKAGEVWTESTATGLFQLTRPHLQKYYPDGMQGIGDKYNEIIGGLRYIQDRKGYGSPDAAWDFHRSHNWY